MTILAKYKNELTKLNKQIELQAGAGEGIIEQEIRKREELEKTIKLLEFYIANGMKIEEMDLQYMERKEQIILTDEETTKKKKEQLDIQLRDEGEFVKLSDDLWKQAQRDKIEALQGTLDVMSNVLNTASKFTKENSAEYKTIAIAQATFDTF